MGKAPNFQLVFWTSHTHDFLHKQ